MKKMFKSKSYGLILAHIIFVLLFGLLLQFYLANHKQSTANQIVTSVQTLPAQVTYKVTRVIDGDTFEIVGGNKVRLIGVDTPEMNGGGTKKDCFALEAKNKLESLVLNRDVILDKDISETDKYGRLLRYVYLDKLFINDLLVRDGFARIATFPPDVKYVNTFVQSEKQAREQNLGLWSMCK